MDIGGRFAGYTADSLAEQLRAEGLNIPNTDDEDLIVSFALEHYAGRPIPPPPMHRDSHQAARRKSRIKEARRQSRLKGSRSGPNTTTEDRVRAAQEANQDRGSRRSNRSSKRQSTRMQFVDPNDEKTLRASARINTHDLEENSGEYFNEDIDEPIDSRNDTMDIPTDHPYRNHSNRERPYRNYSNPSSFMSSEWEEYDIHDMYLDDDEIDRVASIDGPSKKMAKKYGRRFHPMDYEGEPYHLCFATTGRLCLPESQCCDILDEGNISDFAKYGVGMSIYFKFLKWGGWTFFILALLSAPQMMLNLGGGIPESGSFVTTLFITTFGNLADTDLILESSNNTNITTLVIPDEATFPNSSLALPGLNCGDGSSCTISRETATKVYAYSDMVVVVTFLLSALYLRFFTLRESSVLGKRFRKIEHYTVQIDNLPKNCGEAALKMYLEEHLGYEVHDIVFAKDNGKMIELYLHRGKIVSKIAKAVGIARNIKATIRDRAGNTRVSMGHQNYQRAAQKFSGEIKRVISQYDQGYAEYIMVNEKRHLLSAGSRSITAFVTFETREGYEACMLSMRKTLTRCKKSKKKPSNTPGVEAIDLPPFQGKKLISLKAPPPSTINWENLEYPYYILVFRRAATTLAAVVAILICFSVSYGAQTYRVELSSQDILASGCELFNTTLIDNNGDFSPGATQEQKDCFCAALSFTNAAISIVNRDDRCHDYWAKVAPLFAFTSLATGLIAAVNVIAGMIARILAKFERHRSVESREYSIGKRMFIAFFINVGLALLLVNARLNFLAGAVLIGSGQYDDFTTEWYANVGTLLITTVAINIFAPHMVGVGMYVLRKFQIMTFNGKVQMQLNELYLGPEFVPSYRYGQTLTTIMVSMLYGAGMPIFYTIAMISFCVYYWVDKWLFLHWYATPSDFGSRLAEFASYVVLYAVPLHIGFAIWMYSTPGFFVIGQGTFFNRITLDHTTPMLFLFAVSLAVIVLDTALYPAIRSVWNCFYKIPANPILDDDGDIFENVTQAKEDRLFRVLDSYNILENRRYMRAFGITPNFAKSHQGVDAVYREFRDQELPQLPEEIRTMGFA